MIRDCGQVFEQLIPQKHVLDDLITMLDVDVVTTTECVVSPGWCLTFPGCQLPGLHYNLKGHGQMFVGNAPAIALIPHTMVITPPGQPFRIDVMNGEGRTPALKVMEAHRPRDPSPRKVETFVIGDGEPALTVICDHFRASYGSSVHLFAGLRSPIVEQFDATDHLADKLQAVAAELDAQQVGMEMMMAALLKQVLVAVLRRSLNSADVWLRRFSMLGDPQIARALADMMARPGARHSLSTLSETAGLSRSAFMSRFNRSLQSSPMVVLRHVRMRHAANLLTAKTLSVDQVAREVGYSSRSSFLRTFRLLAGTDPSDILLRE
jgi:AraC-like DNA-binding protein